LRVKTPLVILLGGFLGAGKTTLLARAAERLAAQGKRVGFITNDQAPNLVDTALLQAGGKPVQEVSGGCFCCRFDDLITAMDRLAADQTVDVLLGEPVGSCTDLSATVLQPIKRFHQDRFCAAPFSVLVDHERLRALDHGSSSIETHAFGFSDNVMYIYRKQLEEADLIALNKVDLLSDGQRAWAEAVLAREFPNVPILSLSARTGTGVDEWLDLVTKESDAGMRITEVDYDRYAAGEAALAWLNATAELHSEQVIDWKDFCVKLVDALREELRSRSAEIAHLKVHMSVGDEQLTSNLTTTASTLSIRGLIERPSHDAHLIVNIRAHIDAKSLDLVFEQGAQAACGRRVRMGAKQVQCFAPARPQPKHRFQEVV
jgi:G3E family GTPase